MPITGIAAGHPNVRATHAKTLELVRENAIGARATCVVAVAAAIDEHALARLHGQVELTLAAGGSEARVRGRLNPAFQPGDPLVVRRAPAVTRDALVIDADRSAADLPRPLVAELARAGARVELTVEAVAAAAGAGVLVVRPLDAGEARETDGAEIAAALAAGERVALEADLATDEEARRAIHAAHDAGHTVIPAPGVSAPAAVRAVAGLPPGNEVMEDVAAEQVDRRLRASGGTRGAVVLDPGTPREEYLPWRRGERLVIAGARGRSAAFAVTAEEPSHERAEAMAAAGASTRDVARALQDAGLPRRRAYELARGQAADTSSVSRPDPRTSR